MSSSLALGACGGFHMLYVRGGSDHKNSGTRPHVRSGACVTPCELAEMLPAERDPLQIMLDEEEKASKMGNIVFL